MKTRYNNAFTIIEAIIMVLVLGFLAFIAIPRLNLAAVSKNKTQTSAAKIVSDLRLTRRFAVSDAANNTVGFELKLIGLSPYTSYEIKNSDTLETITSHTLASDVKIVSPTGIRFMFGPLGNLKLTSATEMTVFSELASFTITINPATGTVKCSEN